MRTRAADGPAQDGGWRAALTSAGAVLRRIIGAPDYEAYLAHHRRAHPTCAPLSAEEFHRDRLAQRYDKPGSRCC